MDSDSNLIECVSLHGIHLLSPSAAKIPTLTDKRPAVPELHIRTSAASR